MERKRRTAPIALAIGLFVLFCAYSGLAATAQVVLLTKDFTLQVSGQAISAGRPTTLKAENVAKEVTKVSVSVSVNGGPFGAPIVGEVAGGNWSVTIPPFPPNALVTLRFELLKQLLEKEQEELNKRFNEALNKLSTEAMGWKAIEIGEYQRQLRSRFLAILPGSTVESLRTSEGKPFLAAVDEFLRKADALLPGLVNAAQRMKEKTKDVTEHATKIGQQCKNVVLTAQEEGKRLSGLQDEEPETFCEATEGLDPSKFPTEVGKATGAENCAKAVEGELAAAIRSCRGWNKAKEELTTARENISKLAVFTVAELRTLQLTEAQLPVRDIEAWAAFSLGLVQLQETRQAVWLFVVDIQPGRIEMGHQPRGDQWYQWFSLSVGKAFSAADVPGAEETYFVGVGVRPNPYMHVHIGRAFSNGKLDEVRIRRREWSYGVSLNVREVAHVLGLFSELPARLGKAGEA